MSCRCSLRARLLVLVHIFCPCLAIYLRPLCFQIVVGSCVIVVGSCVIAVGSCVWTTTLRLTCLGMSNTDADTINAMPRGKTAAPLCPKLEKQNRSRARHPLGDFTSIWASIWVIRGEIGRCWMLDVGCVTPTVQVHGWICVG